MKYLAVLAVIALVGCKQAQPPTQIINSTGDGNTNISITDGIAPKDAEADRYVRTHDCKVGLIRRMYSRFDYEAGVVRIVPGYTLYNCKNPDVDIFVDFAGAK